LFPLSSNAFRRKGEKDVDERKHATTLHEGAIPNCIFILMTYLICLDLVELIKSAYFYRLSTKSMVDTFTSKKKNQQFQLNGPAMGQHHNDHIMPCLAQTTSY